MVFQNRMAKSEICNNVQPMCNTFLYEAANFD